MVTSENKIRAIMEAHEYQSLPIRSVLISKYGRTKFEMYFEPYERGTLQRVYSVTKSFVSLVILSLVTEGKISLDDRIVDFFPEYINDETSELLTGVRLRDALSMKSCFTKTTYKEGGLGFYPPSWRKDYLKSYFDSVPDKVPGTSFDYESSSFHVMAALIEKITGIDFVSYLRNVLLKDIRISEEAYILRAPDNSPIGGGGLMMAPSDLLNTMKALMGREITGISNELINEALTANSFLKEKENHRIGYGLGFWIMDRGVAMYGMGGQYAIADSSSDSAVVITSDTLSGDEDDGKIIDLAWDIADNIEPGDEPVEINFKYPRPGIIKNKIVPIRKGRFGIKDTPIDLYLDFSEKGGVVGFKNVQGWDYEFKFEFGTTLISYDFPFKSHSPCSVSADLDDCLFINIRLLGVDLGVINIRITLSDPMKISIESFGELMFEGFDVNSYLVKK